MLRRLDPGDEALPIEGRERFEESARSGSDCRAATMSSLIDASCGHFGARSRPRRAPRVRLRSPARPGLGTRANVPALLGCGNDAPHSPFGASGKLQCQRAANARPGRALSRAEKPPRQRASRSPGGLTRCSGGFFVPCPGRQLPSRPDSEGRRHRQTGRLQWAAVSDWITEQRRRHCRGLRRRLRCGLGPRGRRGPG